MISSTTKSSNQNVKFTISDKKKITKYTKKQENKICN